MRDFFAAFGLCIHRWGAWYLWTGKGHRLAQPGEPAVRQCKYCNAREER